MAMSTVYLNSQSNTGTCTITVQAANNVTWNLTSLSVSMAGGSIGPNAKLTIYDGPIGGVVLFAAYLAGPGTGSVGNTQSIPLPRNAQDLPGVQSLTGNAMNIQVIGTANNQVSINARVTDGLP